MSQRRLRLILLGVGAMRSPRYAPAGLLVEYRNARVMVDGGPGAEPDGRLDAWLVTDDRGELIAALRRLARARSVESAVARYQNRHLTVAPKRVVHTSHPAFGYVIEADGRRVVWAPEFWRFPRWAAGSDLMFAEAASWNRPIAFAGGVGGHLDALSVARDAQRRGVGRLVLAHLGRPTLRALDAGAHPSFGEVGADGDVYVAAGRSGWRRRRADSRGESRSAGRSRLLL